MLKVRLFRPFSIEHLLAVLPAHGALDRGARPHQGAGLRRASRCCSDVTVGAGRRRGSGSARRRCPASSAVATACRRRSSRRRWCKAVFDELAADAPRAPIHGRHPRRRLRLVAARSTTPSTSSRTTCTRALFYGLGADGTVSATRRASRSSARRRRSVVQGHFEYDSKKAGSTTVSHLRFGPRPIRSTYRIRRASFVAVHDPEFLERRDVLDVGDAGATVLLNTSVPPDAALGIACRARSRTLLVERRCRLFVIDGYAVAERARARAPHQHGHADLLLRALRGAARSTRRCGT